MAGEGIHSQERAALDAALSRLGLDLDDGVREALLLHLHLLVEKNKELNLTRVDGVEEGIVLHVEDSLAVMGEFSHAAGPFCDIGTGGGFPGIPLALASGREGVLLDSVKKKSAAVREFVRQLGIEERVRVLGERSEELAREEPESFDTVVARAVSSLAAVEELGTPLLRYGGRLVALRGRETSEDIALAESSARILGLDLVGVRDFAIGSDRVHRSVYVYERVRESQVKLPRKFGMAQKRPLR